jgi:hypothetical protein
MICYFALFAMAANYAFGSNPPELKDVMARNKPGHDEKRMDTR